MRQVTFEYMWAFIHTWPILLAKPPSIREKQQYKSVLRHFHVFQQATFWHFSNQLLIYGNS